MQVGESAPDFTLPDVEGSPVALSDLLKHGPVVLTFYRGEWCPFCNLTLRAYQRFSRADSGFGEHHWWLFRHRRPSTPCQRLRRRNSPSPFSVMSAISWPASTVSSSRWSRPSERSTRALERSAKLQWRSIMGVADASNVSSRAGWNGSSGLC